jgi:multidrug transporter EmrE-like cation transporter
MNALKIVGIILIVAGVIGLATGGFSYTKETHKADIGPIHVAVEDKQQVNVPLWVGIGAIVAGIVLLVLPRK